MVKLYLYAVLYLHFSKCITTWGKISELKMLVFSLCQNNVAVRLLGVLVFTLTARGSCV